jgi:NADH-quinone oxidoreductase subunit C
MSKAAVARLTALLGARVLETRDAFGDDEIRVAPGDWLAAAQFVRGEAELACDHFGDLTAVDYPEREPDEPRFEVVFRARSTAKRHRIAVRTRVADGAELDSLAHVWLGANWAEREVYDMFGLRFRGHPDLRRILMYEEFVGHPLRKDYPIDRAQPLVPYREVEGIHKLAPFGIEEGQPFGRVRWDDRLAGDDKQVSPSLAKLGGQRRALSDSEIAAQQSRELDAKVAAAAAEAAAAPKAGE